MEPSTNRMRSAMAARLSRRPLERSSITVTFAPYLTSASHRCEPMNPAPPVTQTFRLRYMRTNALCALDCVTRSPSHQLDEVPCSRPPAICAPAPHQKAEHAVIHSSPEADVASATASD